MPLLPDDRIDPKTGLAKLPKNCFWRVGENRLSTGEVLSYTLDIIERETKTTTTRGYFGKEITFTEEVETELVSGDVWDFKDIYRMGLADVLTEENIRRSTLEILKDFEDELAKRERQKLHGEKTKALLGDYPPKKINREETK